MRTAHNGPSPAKQQPPRPQAGLPAVLVLIVMSVALSAWLAYGWADDRAAGAEARREQQLLLAHDLAIGIERAECRAAIARLQRRLDELPHRSTTQRPTHYEHP